MPRGTFGSGRVRCPGTYRRQCWRFPAGTAGGRIDPAGVEKKKERKKITKKKKNVPFAGQGRVHTCASVWTRRRWTCVWPFVVFFDRRDVAARAAGENAYNSVSVRPTSVPGSENDRRRKIRCFFQQTLYFIGTTVLRTGNKCKFLIFHCISSGERRTRQYLTSSFCANIMYVN